MAKHFKTLSQNHDELIKIKDEYKLANDELRKKNAQLLDENNNMTFPLVQQKEEELKKLRNNSESLKTENVCLQKSIRLSKEHAMYSYTHALYIYTRTASRRTYTYQHTCLRVCRVYVCVLHSLSPPYGDLVLAREANAKQAMSHLSG